jgi:hypothetical protein
LGADYHDDHICNWSVTVSPDLQVG